MTVAVYTLGCKVNIYESEFVISLLKKNNYEIVDFNEKADIYIINTCSVTNESDKKNRKIINEAKRKNSDSTSFYSNGWLWFWFKITYWSYGSSNY